jgi:very-short-patch-repair endonuclease
LKQSKPLSENPGCLSLFSGKRKAKRKDAGALPYQINDKFVTPAELSFYLQACEVLEGKYVICPKVALGELVSVISSRQNQMARNQISQKSVDFVVCDAATMKPIYAIELDDASHDRKDRQDRDKFVNQVFQSIGLPLLRMNCQSGYSHQEMVEFLLAPLQQGYLPQGYSRSVAAQSQAQPQERRVVCPNCGSGMKKVVVTAGVHIGEYYWKCTQYPKCPTFYPAGEREKN